MEDYGRRREPAPLDVRGSLGIVPTPFKENQDVSCESFHALIGFPCANGACIPCFPA
jgi:hypothetical protein